MSREVQDAPLPEGGQPEYGWRVTWRRHVGRRTIDRGVVLEFEPDTEKASAAFDEKCRTYLKDKDIKSLSAGHGYCGDIRTGKAVEMKLVPREVRP